MKYILLLIITLLPSHLWAADDTKIEQNCSAYSHLRTTLNALQAQNSCKKIKDRYALACVKIAITYTKKEAPDKLIQSCGKINTGEKLKCVVNKAITAKSNHVKKINACS